MDFNMFDIVVLGLILLISLKGLISGFTKELFTAIGIIGGLFVATFYNKDVAQYISSNFLSDTSIKLLELISLIAIFILFFLIVKILYKIIDSIRANDYISVASRLAGMIVKMLTLFFIFSIVIYSFSSKPQVTEKFKDTLNSSKLYPILKNSGSFILNASNTLDNNITKESETTADKNSTQEANNTNKVVSDTNITNESNSSTTIQEHNTTDENATTKVEVEATSDNNTSTDTTLETNQTDVNKSSSTTETNSSKE